MAQVSLEKDDRESLWLLVGGPKKLPKAYAKSGCDKVRTKGDGSYVNGINKDIKLMKKTISGNDNFELFKTLKKNDKLTKKTVLKNITAIIKQAWLRPIPAVIYYTGMGLKEKGDWLFTDESLSISDLLNAIPEVPKQPDNMNDDDNKKTDEDALNELINQSAYAVYIISDCAYSGKWRKQLRSFESSVDIFYYASVDGKKNKLPQDTKEGGKFTRFLLSGNKMLGMPEPVAIEVSNGLIFDSAGILWSDQIINQIKGNKYKNVVSAQ